MKINIKQDLIKNLGIRYKVLLKIEGLTEYEFDEQKTILYSRNSDTFYIKYNDSPLPYSIDVKLLFDMVVKDLTAAL